MALAEESSFTYDEIAAKFGVTRKTVSNTIEKYNEEGTVSDRTGRGRKRKISDVEAKAMVREAKKGKFATEIAKEYTICTKKNINPQTVCNVMSFMRTV